MTEDLWQKIVASLDESLSEQDRKELDAWLAEAPENQEQYDHLAELWQKSGGLGHLAAIDAEADWQQVKGQLDPEVKSIPKKRWYREFAVAASVAVILALGTWLMQEPTPTALIYATGAQPTEVTLEDGTVVALNREARLVVAADFGKAQRQVTLEGEAFFDVARNPEKPFVIRTGATTTKVLGTSFNIDESAGAVDIQVRSGLVAFWAGDDTLRLSKDMSARADDEGVNLQPFDPNAFAWQTGILQFDDQPLEAVLPVLESHYGVTITTEDLPEALTVTAVFDNQPLSEVLDEIALIHGLQLRQQDQQFQLLQ